MSALPPFDSLWNYSDPAGTELKFREILDNNNTLSDLSYHLQLLTQIARTYSLRRMFSEAHGLLDEVREALPNDPDLAQVRYHLERGRTYNSNSDKDSARQEFNKALEISEKLNTDFHTVDALHMLAIVSAPDEAIDWNNKAMRIAEESSDERANNWLGSLYNNLGWSYFDKADYEQALSIFQKGLDRQRKKGREYPAQIAKWTVARTLRAMGKIEESLAMQLELKKENKEEDGYNFEELGECLLLLGRNEESKPYFAKAHMLLKEDAYLQSQEADRLKRLLELSN
jgi:tetratricopeptide (TPR) repeat protein